MRWRSRQPDDRSLATLHAKYRHACDADDYDSQLTLLGTITTSYPEVSWAWFDLGLRRKWTRDWTGSQAANLRALELVEETEGAPEAWNLGIAATANRDWRTARRAWSAFGITLPAAADEAPIEADFGITPIRLNPEPRFAEPALEFDGTRYSTEVVWARRLCPTRARIVNVPMPDSGHRFGDVVLHDGDPVGTRRLGDSERSVFNEIALFERGPNATLTAIVDEASPDDLRALEERFGEHGFAAENWTHSVQMLCRACSESDGGGQPHNHPPREQGSDAAITLGIAAPIDDAERILDSWLEPLGLRRGPVMPAT